MYLKVFCRKMYVTLSVYTVLSCNSFAADAKEIMEACDRPAEMLSQPCPPLYKLADLPAIELLRSVCLELNPKNIDAANTILCVAHCTDKITARDVLLFNNHSRP